MSDFIGGIGHALWDAVLPSMATIVAGMVALLLKKMLAKYGLEVTEKQEERLKQIVVDKIHATEEAAHRQPMDSVEKSVKTQAAVMEAATADPQIPNPSVEKVSAEVDAELAKARAAGMLLPNPGLPGLGKR